MWWLIFPQERKLFRLKNGDNTGKPCLCVHANERSPSTRVQRHFVCRSFSINFASGARLYLCREFFPLFAIPEPRQRFLRKWHNPFLARTRSTCRAFAQSDRSAPDRHFAFLFSLPENSLAVLSSIWRLKYFASEQVPISCARNKSVLRGRNEHPVGGGFAGNAPLPGHPLDNASSAAGKGRKSRTYSRSRRNRLRDSLVWQPPPHPPPGTVPSAFPRVSPSPVRVPSTAVPSRWPRYTYIAAGSKYTILLFSFSRYASVFPSVYARPAAADPPLLYKIVYCYYCCCVLYIITIILRTARIAKKSLPRRRAHVRVHGQKRPKEPRVRISCTIQSNARTVTVRIFCVDFETCGCLLDSERGDERVEIYNFFSENKSFWL